METILGGGETAANEDMIKDSDVRSFGEDVIVASRTRPVIVDFWADWCGPCKQLMPALEAAVNAAGGAVALVKVNADQNQTLCSQLQVQSLPTVLAFWQGQPVDGFQGAVPPSQLKTFIDRLVQLAGGEGGADDGDPLAEALAHADELFEAGEVMQAAQVYQQILMHDEGNTHALIGMADASVKLGQGDKTGQILEAIDETKLEDAKLKERLARIHTALELAAEAKDAGDAGALEAEVAADPMNHEARYKLALAYQGQGALDKAAEALLGIIMRDREWNDDAARKQLLKLFEAQGATDPFTLKYRRRLSSVLFS
ncbi:tetratricopeptide repeat protein [Kordiimonas sp.]|uniref:tetratricopeptide repeat protein n=1 Tax=Kordiimonas sp. TaxID=1970157 RepID=UPI003A8E2E8A